MISQQNTVWYTLLLPEDVKYGEFLIHQDSALRSALLGIETAASNVYYGLIQTKFKLLQVQKIFEEGPIFECVHTTFEE